MHRGAAVLQQPGGHRQPQGSEEAQGLPFQEGNRNLQLLLLQHNPGCQAQQTGEERDHIRKKKTGLHVTGGDTDCDFVLASMFRD